MDPILPWQKDLGRDVAAKVRGDLESGKVPWIAYDSKTHDNQLVLEYPDGKKAVAELKDGEFISRALLDGG